MGENIKTVYAMINGQKVVATYNAISDTYTIETSAPPESSWGQPGHVYTISLHAEDKAGNTVEMTSEDPIYGDQLKIRVLEKTPPTATIAYPTEDSVIGEDQIDIQLEIGDAGGSGINLSSVAFTINGSAVKDLDWHKADNSEKYTASYHAYGLHDGTNVLKLSVTDNDGNTSEDEIVNFIVSTIAASLDITTPTEGLLTNDKTVTVSGVAKPGSSSTTVTSITVNEREVSFDPVSGQFMHEVSLVDGENTITIVATDSAGHKTTVIRHVTVDTKAPIISDVHAEALTVDVGGMIKITFKVTDPDD